MVFGYPGSTREYLPACAVDLIVNHENPLKIGLRQQRLDIMNSAMEKSRLTRIQYAAKANGIANFWKKMIGESRGIRRIDAIAKKEQQEKAFQEWTTTTPARAARYGGLLTGFSNVYGDYLPLDLSSVYITEAGQGIELVKFISGFRELVRHSMKKPSVQAEIDKSIQTLVKGTRDFYKNYEPSVDNQVMAAMLKEMASGMESRYRPSVFSEIEKKYKNNFVSYTFMIFSKSVFSDSARLIRFLSDYRPSQVKTIVKDPAYVLMNSIYERMENDIVPGTRKYSDRLDSLQRIYMAGLVEMQKGRNLYPDANSTLLVAYGKVDDYTPADAVTYQYYTTLAGVIQKEDSAVYDYRVDARLKKLYEQRDYGRYADRDGTLHVAFTSSNHTTGGNSGSPVLNAEGQLIGINFDRNWEGTLSDLMYDPAQCRNISLDIRYCLFVIDKVAGANRLIREMKIVQP